MFPAHCSLFTIIDRGFSQGIQLLFTYIDSYIFLTYNYSTCSQSQQIVLIKKRRRLYAQTLYASFGDKNGNNIGFYARTKGTITVYYNESTDDIWVEGAAVEMAPAQYKLHDTIYDPIQTTTAPPECTTAPSTEPVTVLKKGDVDNDGVVTIADATKIQTVIAEFTTLTAEQEIAADVNKNGIADINDVTKIQMLLANEIPDLD